MSDLYPILTIGVPTYNRLYCIDRVLQSIFSQSYPKKYIKLIFVDNYSTDGTFEVLKNFVENVQKEYLAVELHQVRSNIPQARNICLKNMIGDFILFWDSDVLAPDEKAVERMVKFMLKENSVSALGIPYYLEGEKKLDEKMYMIRLDKGITEVSGLGLGFTLIRKDVFDKIGGFNEKMAYSEDTEFFLRAKKAKLMIVADSATYCIHLKPDVFKHSRGYMAKARSLNYLKYVKYCFQVMPTIYNEFLATGSITHYFRLIIYLFLPLALVLTFFYWFVPLLYFIPLLAYHIYKAKRNRLYGFLTFFYYLLPGLALSYGYIFYKLRKRKQEIKPFKSA
ncbi:MAG: glycosyltransferase [Nitrososphaeria archaeon]|nr:glycosyltransferase [Nitrososphaeria archaeon]